MLGDKIKTLRKKKNISQKELSDLLFVSRSLVAKWEVNELVPDEENLEKIASIFAVDLDCFSNDNNLSYDETKILKLKKKNNILLILCVLILGIFLMLSVFEKTIINETKPKEYTFVINTSEKENSLCAYLYDRENNIVNKNFYFEVENLEFFIFNNIQNNVNSDYDCFNVGGYIIFESSCIITDIIINNKLNVYSIENFNNVNYIQYHYKENSERGMIYKDSNSYYFKNILIDKYSVFDNKMNSIGLESIVNVEKNIKYFTYISNEGISTILPILIVEEVINYVW